MQRAIVMAKQQYECIDYYLAIQMTEWIIETVIV